MAEVMTRNRPVAEPSYDLADDIKSAELQAYRDFIAKVAYANDGSTVFNRNPSHAAVVIERLLSDARVRINILTGKLFRAVYAVDYVVDAAVRFLDNNSSGEIHILSEEPVDERHPLLDAIASSGLRSRLSTQVLKRDLTVATPFHFVVADGRSFRFEADKTVMEAVVQFGAPDIGQKLNLTFSNLWATNLSPGSRN